jgi:hypothetical protein
MSGTTPPRLYCIPAIAAPVVAVLRRGPSDWSQVGRWDLAAGRYEPGAWLRGRIFPRRCDLSPDGRWLCAFAHKPTATWEHGEAYVVLSKLPWLHALHAFGTCGTWTRGYHFTEDGSCDAEEDRALPIPYGLRSIPIVQFANERRRGWEEAPDCPPRDPKDTWDMRRSARMQKRQPGGQRLLRVESLGAPGGEFGIDQAVDGLRVCYALESGGDFEIIDDLQWADWDTQGRLLAATRDGRLQVRKLEGQEFTVAFEADLAGLEPDPAPAPAQARRW